jgi:hypothetical protein
MSGDQEEPLEDPPITWTEVRDWAEFFGWTTLVLWPFLYWVNGPSVSDDQFVVRCILIIVAACCAFGVRGGKIWVNRRSRTCAVPKTQEVGDK